MGPPQIQVDPVVLNFAFDVGQGPEARAVSIVNAGGEPLTISAVDLQLAAGVRDFALTALPPLPTTLRPGQSAFVEVTYTVGQGPAAATLIISSNDPQTPAAQVPISSRSKFEEPDPPPTGGCLELSPSSLNFGSVPRGNNATRTFDAVNCGQLPVSVSAIERGRFFGRTLTQEFQITQVPAFPFTVPAGGRQTIEVAYEPGLAGIDTGKFLVRNDSQTGLLELRVNGVGDQPERGTQDFHVQMEWDAETDVDLHLLGPGGSFFQCPDDCFFSNRNPDWGTMGDWTDDPFLDVDNVDGFGPENINIQTPKPGTYKVLIHYYRDSETTSGSSTDANATVRFYNRGQLVQEWGPTNLPSTGDTWEVFEIEWPSAQITTLGGVTQRNPSSGGFCRPTFP